MHDGPKVKFANQGQVAGRVGAFQDKQWFADAGLAQYHRLFSECHRNRVDIGFNVLGDAHRAMAVSVCFDHRHKFLVRQS